MVSQPVPDYYKVLELPRTCTSEEINSAYRRLALIRHPDKNLQDPNATAKFQQLGQAYETLSDPTKRREYDPKYGCNPEAIHQARRYHLGNDHSTVPGFGNQDTGSFGVGYNTSRPWQDPFSSYQHRAYQAPGPQSTGSYNTTQGCFDYPETFPNPDSYWTDYLAVLKQGPPLEHNVENMGKLIMMELWAWKKSDYEVWKAAKIADWEMKYGRPPVCFLHPGGTHYEERYAYWKDCQKTWREGKEGKSGVNA